MVEILTLLFPSKQLVHGFVMSAVTTEHLLNLNNITVTVKYLYMPSVLPLKIDCEAQSELSCEVLTMECRHVSGPEMGL